jgi:hypothetical protein
MIYPRPVPSIKALPFETLANLAEAAEKYEVYSVMHMCKTRIEWVLPVPVVESLR